jgi:hypothetical protein
MYRFPVERPRKLRAWVCLACETGGKDTPPLTCWCCRQPAVDVGASYVTMCEALITRVIRQRRTA